MARKRTIPVRSADSPADDFVPPFPWLDGVDETTLSTKRGFVFQFPPFGVLDHAAIDAMDERTSQGLYLHIPFCPYRCSYCYYAVEVNRGDDAIDRYVRALAIEMALVASRPGIERGVFKTAFIGGGTPTYLDEQRLVDVISAAARHFDLSALEEFSVEADPTTLTRSKVLVMRDQGVNRISVGVQTFDDDLNKVNERYHTAAETHRAIDAVRSGGIGNLNLDLICGLVGETQENWRRTVTETVAIAPEHITIYLFSYRPQTRVHVRVANGALPNPPEEAERIEMYRWAREVLLGHGYEQTTPNCYVRGAEFEQLHQRNAWDSRPLIGLGNSAYSFFDDWVTQNVRATSTYSDLVAAGQVPIETCHHLNSRESMVRYCVLRLKQLSLSRAEFRSRFGFDVSDVLGDELSRLEELGLIVVTDAVVELTEPGIIYVDDVCRTIYTPEVRERLAHLDDMPLRPLVKSLI